MFIRMIVQYNKMGTCILFYLRIVDNPLFVYFHITIYKIITKKHSLTKKISKSLEYSLLLSTSRADILVFLSQLFITAASLDNIDFTHIVYLLCQLLLNPSIMKRLFWNNAYPLKTWPPNIYTPFGPVAIATDALFSGAAPYNIKRGN